ncbi:MAG: hypothetical protein RL391_351 [Actinomycetota bacterium]|jgi:aminoglycoside phosphotransferase (APT) family kinase protein
MSARESALVDWLAGRLGWSTPNATVERIGEGHSREMLIVTPERENPVVVRAEQGGVFGTTSDEECRVMRAVADRGVPVARIIAEESGSVIGRPFFVMEYVDGADGQPPTQAFVDTLHRVHSLEVDAELASAFDRRPTSVDDAILGQIARWEDVYRSSVTTAVPALDHAATWLRERVPNDGVLAVVHGDAGPGNFVHDGRQVLALTDWEFAHLGDPREDWSFCVAMRGARAMKRDTWLQLIEERAQVHFDAESWRYWEAFNLFKGACANLTCRHLYATGRNPAPNMAIVGTAVHRLFLDRLTKLLTD